MVRDNTVESNHRPIFVVDDESLVAMGMVNMLERNFDEPVHAFSSAEAMFDQLDELKPGLILMDIRLGPGMDGLAAAREVMERHPCPVIITTAYAEEEYLRQAQQSHVFGYLVKPVTAKQLASAIRLARGRFAEFRRLQEENEDLRQALETRKLVERAKGLLMERKDLTEPQAYELIRSQSQEQSRSMAEIAQRIIDAAQFL